MEVQARQAALLHQTQMKRIDLDRAEIERALVAEPSITKAAKALGVARRTLQDRMRALGMARGKAGHPTRPIKYRKRSRGYRASSIGLAAVGLIGGVLVGRHVLAKGSKA